MTFQVATLLIMLLGVPPGSKLPRLDVGIRAFNQGDFEGALRALDQAALEGGDPATLEKVHLLRAQCFAARQDFVRTEEAFALALESNPDASLDPARVDPTLVKLLEAVRARLTGTLIVNSTPDGAGLFLDGKNAGVTPQTLQAPIGHHKLELRWGEGPMSPLEVQVRPRKEIRIEWVQAAAPPAVVGPEKPEARPIRPFGDLRFTFEVPATPQAPITYGLDLGGGFEVGYFRAGLWARMYPYFGVVPRGQFVLPVIDQVSVLLEAEVPVLFESPSQNSPTGIALGIGGAGGAEFSPTKWFVAFLQIGGQHLFLTPRNDPTHFVATVGARLRLP